jgi:hypothetical protein
VCADRAGQPLGSATARHDPEKRLRLTDEEVPVSHHAKIAGPSELRVETERRTVEGGNEDDPAPVHPQERRVQAVELHGSP